MTKGGLVARAVKRAIEEHGSPNRFSPRELSAYYCRLSPLAIGLSAWDATLRLRDEGFDVSYGDRHFVVR